MLQSICVSLPLGGCLLAGDKPEPGLNIPPAYSAGPRNPAAAEAAVPPLDWWRGFRSRELTEIIEEARAANLDIAAAVARIVQADANSRIVGAALLPIIDFNGNATHSQQSKTTGSSSVVNVSRSGANIQIINNNLSAVLSAKSSIISPRSAPVTRSISGARTALLCAQLNRQRWPAGSIERSSPSPP